eukprot:12822531-Prorocentrum_lima.AAC.1
MTSSLVGSEMCIRDRTTTSNGQSGDPAKDASPAALPFTTPPLETPDAVSRATPNGLLSVDGATFDAEGSTPPLETPDAVSRTLPKGSP